MSGLRRVLSEAERRVRPTQGQESKLSSLADKILDRTKAAASQHPETRGAVLGGSFAKGTWLPDEADLDIFVKFDPVTPDEKFERLGLAIGAAATRGYPRGKKFAQHPYTEALVDRVKVNVVPCFDVLDKKWKSAADRSPFHVELVESAGEETKTQVRLLKKFMKTVGVYGAEIQTQGFSGYVAEVLVLKHGSLRGVLEWFASGLVVEGRRFSLPDPVDEGRDLGVAVSNEKLGRMMLASREFLSRPSSAYFAKLTPKQHPKMGKNVYAVVFIHKKLSEDTLWGELRKTCKHLVTHLEVRGFKVARSMSASDNSRTSAFLFVPEFDLLPELEQRVGPTVDRRKDVEAFIESNRKETRLVWVDDDARVRLLRPRGILALDKMLGEAIKGRMGPLGASPEMESGMRRTGRVLRGGALERESKTKRWLRDGIREISSDAIGTSTS